MTSDLSPQNRIRGCLLGGAIGDALGAPVEFMSTAEIRRRFGPDGIGAYSEAYGRRGAITDDTQMTLFTAEGMLRAFVRETLKGIPAAFPSVVSHAYLRWLRTQGVAAPNVREIGLDGWLWTLPALHSRRAPGNTCVSALAGLEGFTVDRAPNDSKGAGAIMRVAPVGLMAWHSDEMAGWVFDQALQISWITHGHPSGYLSAAAFAVMIHALVRGRSLEEAIEKARTRLLAVAESGETLGKIDQAMALASDGTPPDEALPAIGGGWVGEEALGIAIYCASVAPDFASAVRMAVNHDGDSDTTGSLVGQLLGARDGEGVLPGHLLRDLELREAITAIADDLAAFLTWDLYGDDEDRIWERYPGW